MGLGRAEGQNGQSWLDSCRSDESRVGQHTECRRATRQVSLRSIVCAPRWHHLRSAEVVYDSDVLVPFLNALVCTHFIFPCCSFTTLWISSNERETNWYTEMEASASSLCVPISFRTYGRKAVGKVKFGGTVLTLRNIRRWISQGF